MQDFQYFNKKKKKHGWHQPAVKKTIGLNKGTQSLFIYDKEMDFGVTQAWQREDKS